jgi:hypothetical protein
VSPIIIGLNPATWMLDVIGAGTSTSELSEDYHKLYLESALHRDCEERLQAIITSHKNELSVLEGSVIRSEQASIFTQMNWVFGRAFKTYWRNPSYSLGRFMVNIIIALIFGSAYPQQQYNDYIGVQSRIAVIYITAMFAGALGMMSVAPVTLADRVVFYRENHSKMYKTWIYSIAYNIVEVSLTVYI